MTIPAGIAFAGADAAAAPPAGGAYVQLGAAGLAQAASDRTSAATMPIERRLRIITDLLPRRELGALRKLILV